MRQAIRVHSAPIPRCEGVSAAPADGFAAAGALGLLGKKIEGGQPYPPIEISRALIHSSPSLREESPLAPRGAMKCMGHSLAQGARGWGGGPSGGNGGGRSNGRLLRSDGGSQDAWHVMHGRATESGRGLRRWAPAGGGITPGSMREAPLGALSPDQEQRSADHAARAEERPPRQGLPQEHGRQQDDQDDARAVEGDDRWSARSGAPGSRRARTRRPRSRRSRSAASRGG